MKLLEKLFSKRRRLQDDGENAVLVEAMKELALKNDAENRKKMYAALLNSTLLIPTPELPPTSRPGTRPDGDVTLQLLFLNDRQGQKLTPAFTDIEALRNWDPNTPRLSAPARGFFETISKYFSDIQGVVINPFDPIRKMIRPMGTITRVEFEVLARGQVPIHEAGGIVSCQLPAAGVGMSIQPPQQTLPTAAAEVLRKSAESIPEIATVYAFSIVHPHGSPQFTLGVGLDRSATKERQQLIIQTLWGTVAPTLISTELKTLDFVVLTEKIAAPAEHNGSKIYWRL